MFRLFSLTSFVVLAAVCFYLLAALDISSKRKTNVIIVTVESLRRDLVNEANTPFLLKVAERGIISAEHKAVSGWTGTNMVSLLSGLSPFTTGVHTRGQSIAAGHELPLERLTEDGYQVEGIQGFMTMDIYQNLGFEVTAPGSDLQYWLADKKRTGGPFVLWYHYLHTHLPYSVSEAARQEIYEKYDPQLREKYLAVVDRPAIHAGEFEFSAEDLAFIQKAQSETVQEFDHWFEHFYQFFQKSGLHENTILILTSDHGEEHGERGNVGHASTSLAGHLHNEILDIPFYMWIPESLTEKLPEPARITNTHMDIMPLVMTLLGNEITEELVGEEQVNPRDYDWIGATSGGGFSEKDPENIEFFVFGIQDGRWKLLWQKGPQQFYDVLLYDIEDDPKELVDLSQQYPGIAKRLHRDLQPFVGAMASQPITTRPLHNTNEFNAHIPTWVYPAQSGTYCYNDLAGQFYFQWTGDKDSQYMLEYKAGHGELFLSGEIEVQGVVKDFGTLSRRYWKTWVLPYSPFKVRVALTGSDNWSEWLLLEACE